MATYRIYTEGYVDVTADDEHEAEEKYNNDDYVQKSEGVTGITLLDEDDVFIIHADEIANL